MFGWLKRRKTDHREAQSTDSLKRLIEPQATAIAIAETIAEHFKLVEQGRIPFPYYKDKGATAQTTWSFTRLEAVRQMFGYGAANLMDMADIRKQRSLMERVFSAKPSLEQVSPCGDAITDTVNGIWSVYSYLDAVGADLMDAETDRLVLNNRGLSIFDGFLVMADEANNMWHSINEPSFTPPPMLVDILWGDVTAKTKSIGLTRVFGPSPKAGLESLINMIRREGGSDENVAALRRVFDRYCAARTPDDATLS